MRQHKVLIIPVSTAVEASSGQDFDLSIDTGRIPVARGCELVSLQMYQPYHSLVLVTACMQAKGDCTVTLDLALLHLQNLDLTLNGRNK